MANLAKYLVLKSYLEWKQQQQATRNSEIEMRRDFVRGGKDTVKYLTQNENEANAKFNDRQNRYANFNYCRTVVDRISSSMNALIPVITIQDTKEMQERVDNLQDNVEFSLFSSKLERTVSIDGAAFVYAYWDANKNDNEDESGKIRLRILDLNNCRAYVDDQMNLTRLIYSHNVAEYDQKKDKEEEFAIVELFSPEEYKKYKITDNESVILIAEWKNPFGQIPLIYYEARPDPQVVDGVSDIADAVLIQKEINNRESFLSKMIRYQAFATPVVKGTPNMDESNGQSSMGVDAPIIFDDTDEKSDFFYRTPDANISDTITSIDKLIERLFDVSSIPISITGQNSGGVESGIALAIKFMPLSDLIEERKERRQFQHAKLFNLMLNIEDWATNNGKGLMMAENEEGEVVESSTNYKWTDYNVNVIYVGKFLPQNEKEELEKDLMLLNAGLTTKRAILKKRNPLMSDEEIDLILKEAEEEKKARQEQWQGMFKEDDEDTEDKE